MLINKKELKPGIIVLELSGPLQMGVECKQLELAFDQVLSDNHKHVIVDLSKVTKLDSGGLGTAILIATYESQAIWIAILGVAWTLLASARWPRLRA